MTRLRRDWPQLAGLTIGLVLVVLVALAVHGNTVFGIPLWRWEVGCFGGPALLAVVFAAWEKLAEHADRRDDRTAQWARLGVQPSSDRARRHGVER